MSVDYFFKRADGAVLCVTNKPYHLPIAFPDGRVPALPGRELMNALEQDWPELRLFQLLAKVDRIERFLGGQPGELLSEYDVHDRPAPVETIGRAL